MRALLTVLALMAVALAGCADEPAPATAQDIVPIDDVELEAGKGAIAGLVVDDRFRPIPDADVLLVEAGQQAVATANGEFQFIDLEPGTYTLRVSAEGHEAAPQSVRVVEGEFAEASLLARRVLDEGAYIYTQEFSVFQFCGLNAILVLTDVCNLVDLSGDSGRASIDLDLTGVADITAVTSEFLADNEGDYELWIGNCLACLDLSAEYYAQSYVNGDYLRCVNVVGAPAEDCTDRNAGTDVFTTNKTLEYSIWVNGMMDDETAGPTFGLSTGIGGQLAFQAQLMISAFIGEPEEDLDTYCVLC